MNIDRPALDAAVAQAIVSREQAEGLWRFLAERDRDTPRFRFAHVLYYLGGMVINVAMIFVGAALGRRVFAVFGGIGVALYLGHLADRVFRDSMLFPLALSAIGLMVIGIGILWQRNEATIEGRLRTLLPTPVRELIERRAA
jgi:hypothetical protein